MKKIFIQLSCVAAICIVALSSCTYRTFADAPYPDNVIYFPLAQDGILDIDAYPAENPIEGVPGEPRSFDVADGNLLVHLGVLQSGVTLRSMTVTLYSDYSTVNTMILDGTLGASTLPVPEGKYSFPATVQLNADGVAAAFDLAIDLATLKGSEYVGKKLAVAVAAFSDDADSNHDLNTIVVRIDPAFLR